MFVSPLYLVTFHALQHPNEWTNALLSLTPLAAKVLLDRWDILERILTSGSDEKIVNLVAKACKEYPISEGHGDTSDLVGSFFGILFHPCGDKIPEVRRYLLTQQSESYAEIGEQMATSVLGFDLKKS